MPWSARSRGPFTRRHYPASQIVRPCPTSARPAVLATSLEARPPTVIGLARLSGSPARRSQGQSQSLAWCLTNPSSPYTLVVLPFTNMSGDPEPEYFSEGITEDIITELSRFSDGVQDLGPRAVNRSLGLSRYTMLAIAGFWRTPRSCFVERSNQSIRIQR